MTLKNNNTESIEVKNSLQNEVYGGYLASHHFVDDVGVVFLGEVLPGDQRKHLRQLLRVALDALEPGVRGDVLQSGPFVGFSYQHSANKPECGVTKYFI